MFSFFSNSNAQYNQLAENFTFNGIDGEFLGKVAGVEKKQTTIKVHAKQRDQSGPSNISLAFCPIKGQRLDFLIQKCKRHPV